MVREGSAARAVSVRYAVRDPRSGGDVRRVSGTLRFAAGQVRRTIPVPVVDDRRMERDEEFLVVLRSLVGGGAGHAAGRLPGGAGQRPDAAVATRLAGPFTGFGIRNITGAGQTRTVTMRRGAFHDFTVDVDNGGNATGWFVVRASAPRAGSPVRYFDGIRDVTRQVRSRAGLREKLVPTSGISMTVRIRVARSAAVGSPKTCRCHRDMAGRRDARRSRASGGPRRTLTGPTGWSRRGDARLLRAGGSVHAGRGRLLPHPSGPQRAQAAARCRCPAGGSRWATTSTRGTPPTARPRPRRHPDALPHGRTAVTNAQFATFVKETGHLTGAEEFGVSAVFHLAWRANPGRQERDVLNRATGTPWWLAVRGADWRSPEGPGSDVTKRQNDAAVRCYLRAVGEVASAPPSDKTRGHRTCAPAVSA